MKDIFVKDWGTQVIDFNDRKVGAQMKTVEIHHKSDGDTQDGPSFTLVLSYPGVEGVVISQISFNMLKESLNELGYMVHRPEHEVWRWWVGADELPKYVKTNPYNLVGPHKVFRRLDMIRENGRVLIKVDDHNVGMKGHLEAHYLLPATFEEYQQFMNAEAV